MLLVVAVLGEMLLLPLLLFLLLLLLLDHDPSLYRSIGRSFFAPPKASRLS
jgi:hypothetical protein